ncbi:MAG: methyltransferase domain-containing protein [Chloroflexota bacterium]
MRADHDYRGLMATSWDLLRGDTSDWQDRAFFRDQIERSGEPALDVGCGTGRLVLEYLRAGIDIDGVDSSPEMLAICREKAAAVGLAPRLYAQAMQDLDLPRTYRTILVPSSSFQLVLDPAEARRAMERFAAHLAPGGTLVLPFLALGRPGVPLEETWVREAVRPEDGATVRRTAWAQYDPTTQLERTRDRYELIVDGRVVRSETTERDPATRGYRVDQAQALVEAAGLSVASVLSDFTLEPYDPSRPHAHDQATGAVFTVIARKP